MKDARQASPRGINAVAVNKLQVFSDQVNAQSGRHITADAARMLVADAQYVMTTRR